jgi:hypothetical protein
MSDPVELKQLRPIGLKARVQMLLTDNPLKQWTLSELVLALGLTKVDNPDVNSVLIKLRNAGLIKASVGPATAPRGRRFVKRYSWVAKEAPRPVVVLEMDVRRQLAFTR